uniref:Heat shock protein 70 n=1 Tax=Rhizophora mucronata TaxID=61149 RepID=A0A2P2LG23_RHIMU
MLGSMMTNARMGQHSQDSQGEYSNINGFDGPEVRTGGSINLNIGENIPEELRGALRSMIGMFSGAVPHGNPQDTMNGRSSAN